MLGGGDLEALHPSGERGLVIGFDDEVDMRCARQSLGEEETMT
jgi:hypothetical protein